MNNKFAVFTANLLDKNLAEQLNIKGIFIFNGSTEVLLSKMSGKIV